MAALDISQADFGNRYGRYFGSSLSDRVQSPLVLAVGIRTPVERCQHHNDLREGWHLIDHVRPGRRAEAPERAGRYLIHRQRSFAGRPTKTISRDAAARDQGRFVRIAARGAVAMPSRDARFVELVPHCSAETHAFQHYVPLSIPVLKAALAKLIAGSGEG